MKFVSSGRCQARKTQKKYKNATCNVNVHLIRNAERKGIGYAIRQGIRYALDTRSIGIVVVLAGNNKDDPREISTSSGTYIERRL